MNSYIKILEKKEIFNYDLTNYIVFDWNNIKSKEELLLPFFRKYNLHEYFWTYSLDTFEDIILDKWYTKTNNIKIFIKNFDNLLLWDVRRKKIFYEILCNCVISNNSICYEILITK